MRCQMLHLQLFCRIAGRNCDPSLVGFWGPERALVAVAAGPITAPSLPAAFLLPSPHFQLWAGGASRDLFDLLRQGSQRLVPCRLQLFICKEQPIGHFPQTKVSCATPILLLPTARQAARSRLGTHGSDFRTSLKEFLVARAVSKIGASRPRFTLSPCPTLTLCVLCLGGRGKRKNAWG